jgi:hypothetical protein
MASEDTPTKPGSGSRKFPPAKCPKCSGTKSEVVCSLCNDDGVVSHFKAAAYLSHADTPGEMAAVRPLDDGNKGERGP